MAYISKTTKACPPARNRGNPFKVYVNEQERAEIAARAARLHMSLSDYLRTVGLGEVLRSTVDATAIDTMLKINADLGRLGGLLRLWLTTRRGEGATSSQINALLRGLQTDQQALLQAISTVRRSR
jgi:hypothetical protein